MKEENLLKDWVMLELASPKLIRSLNAILISGVDFKHINEYHLLGMKGVGVKTALEFVKLKDAEINLEYCNSILHKRDLLLIDFLKKESIYDSFSAEVSHGFNQLNPLCIMSEPHRMNSLISYLLELCGCETSISHEIAGAFIWSSSNEGHSYWARIEDKWKDVCKLNGLV